MVLRERTKAASLTDEPEMTSKMVPNGNKVGDVTTEKRDENLNGISDSDKSPSLSSNGSCTKLTIDKADAGTGCCKTETGSSIFKLAICFLCGIVFGIMFVKGRVFEPQAIRDQMVMENFIMLKMFLSAVCTGQIVLCVLSVLPPTKQHFEDAIQEYVATFTDKGVLTSTIGAFILGIGLTLSGACPGMVLAQVGSWVPNSIFTLIGCLIGALTYGLVAPHITKLFKPKVTFNKRTVNMTLKWPYIAVAAPMAVLLAVAVFLLEYFWDYEKDLISIGRQPPPYDNIVTSVAWRPCIAGGIIGLIQLPLVLVVRDTMGGSSSYVTIVSQWVVTKRLQELFPYLAAKRCGVGNWWQVLYVGGAIIGAIIAAVASDTMATSRGPTLPTALFGGILMLWGARFASGCTSGHGLSGMGVLAWLSFIAVPCMFAGGISLGFTMKATGALHDFVTSTGDA